MPQRRAEYDRGEVRAAPRPRVADGRLRRLRLLGRGAGRRASGFHQIFEGVLGRRRRGRGAPARGEDLEQSARVSFDEAFHGATPPPPRRAPGRRATSCGGTGDVAIGPQPCEACGGRGPGARAPRADDLHPAVPRLRVHGRPRASCRARAAPARGGRCRANGRRSRSRPESATAAGSTSPGSGNAGRRGGPRGRLPPRRPRRAASAVPAPGRRPALRDPGDHDRGRAGRARRGADARTAPWSSRCRRAPRPASASACASAGCRGRTGRAAATSTSRRGCGCPAVRDDESRELLRGVRAPQPPRSAARPRRPRAGPQGALMSPRGKRAPAGGRRARDAAGPGQVLHDQRGGQELRRPSRRPCASTSAKGC